MSHAAITGLAFRSLTRKDYGPHVADKPFVKNDRDPISLKIDDKLTLKCVYIPPGKYLMGTPVWMWPYFQEEYQHMVTLTRPFYMAEVPITQEMYEAVMGNNPSTVKGPQLPVQNPPFADLKKFCTLLSEKNKKTVRLPTDASLGVALSSYLAHRLARRT